MRRLLAVLLENEAGALSRVIGLFAQRNYNIDSLTVAPTEDATLSRLTLLTEGDDEKIEQITKHLNRLIEVVKVTDLTESSYIERELMLIKVRAEGNEQRQEIYRVCEIFRGTVVDVTPESFVVQLTGPTKKLFAFMRVIGESSILEVVRSGVSGISRGDKILEL